MSNTTERPIIEWLRTIADPIVRESAIRQCVYNKTFVTNMIDAIYTFNRWDDTKEWCEYWSNVLEMAKDGQLATIEPSATDWMQEVQLHRMGDIEQTCNNTL